MWWFSLPREVAVVAALFGLVFLWVLLPLRPAILLYRLFPDTFAAASGPLSSGPLSSLTVQARGAFAAYLIILLISAPLTYYSFNEIHGMERPVWTVYAKAEFYDKDGNEVSYRSLLKDIILVSAPERFEHETTSVIFKIPPESNGQFPQLLVKIDKDKFWTSENISLNEELANEKNDTDYFNKVIKIHNPIKISEIPPPRNYDPRTGFQNGLGNSIFQGK